MRIFRLLASHPIFLFKLNKSGFGECYQSAINGDLKNQKPSVYAALRALISTFCLFPLDRCRWFRSDVVADAVDVVNFIDDADRNLIQHLVRDACPVAVIKSEVVTPRSARV